MRKDYLFMASDILFIVYAVISMVKHGADVLSVLIIILAAAAFVLQLVEVLHRG